MKRMLLGATLAALTLTISACGREGATAGTPVASTVTTVTRSATATATAKPASPKPTAQKPPSIAPCGHAHTVAVIAPGEGPTENLWQTSVVVTNRGDAPCTLRGVSKIEFYTGGDGKPLGIKEVTTDGAPQELVRLAPGEQASMGILVPTAVKPVPADCLEGAAFAEITLPGDAKSIEAWLPNRTGGLPPVCGAVEASPWGKGGAPGVN